jgi:hypothetical protein
MAVTGDGLAAQPFGGLIKEDVMDKIFDVSKYPLVFTNLIGTDTSQNPYKEWVVDKLQAPIITNAQVDGAATIQNDDTEIGDREGNYCQISTKTVSVSTRANESGTIGYARELANQISRRQIELRRDCEAAMLSSNASIKGVDATTASQSAGLAAWIITNVDGGTEYSAGGFNTTTGIVDTYTPTTTGRAMTEQQVRDVSRLVYEEGGESVCLMSTPSVIENFSTYLFTSSARVAALYSDVKEKQSSATATGSANIFVSDFSTLKMEPNRIQQPEDATHHNVFLLDPDYLRNAKLSGYRTEPLAKQGLADTRQIAVDWTLCVMNEKAQGMIEGIDPALPVTAS